MRVAILESIVMPAGHEVEFDRILVDELKNQGHEPLFFVPQNFPFKVDYGAKTDYLEGGEVVTYAGIGRLKKLFLSLLREKRRKAWFDSAYDKAKKGLCDAIIVPTASFRFLRTLRRSKLKNSPVDVYFIFHGIVPKDKERFLRSAKTCENFKNIHLKVMTLRDDFKEADISNLSSILPPVYKPINYEGKLKVGGNKLLKLGFFGQFRREKNLGFFLEAFKCANFKTPVKLTVQGATTRKEDSAAFEEYIKKYEGEKNIKFLHKNLIGKEWQDALLNSDVLIMPYAAERYRYQSSAMLFTAIGFYKPVLQSPEINPEVLGEFLIGEAVDLSSREAFSSQLERFVNNYHENRALYQKNLELANKKFSHENLIKSILERE